MSTNVLILAGDTDGNLGDLAIITATCRQIRAIDPHSRISIVTSRPARDRERLGIIPIARGWRGFPALITSARNADLVICGGGGLFQDDDSLIKMPYWALRLTLIRGLARRIAGLAIGAGPLDHRSSRVFAKLALKMLAPVSVRDGLAKDLLAPMTNKVVKVVPDPAFILQALPESDGRRELERNGVPVDQVPLLGVAVRRWFHKSSSPIPYKYAAKFGLHKNRGKQEMLSFMDLAAAALDDVVEKTNAHVVFLPTYVVEHENDLEVCNAVASRMTTGNRTVLHVDDPCLYKSVAGLLSVMLCGRMHPAILAAGQTTPIVGLAYNPKFFGMFSLVGRQASCMSIDDFVRNESSKELAQMLTNEIRDPSKDRQNTSGIERKILEYIEKIVAPEASKR